MSKNRSELTKVLSISALASLGAATSYYGSELINVEGDKRVAAEKSAKLALETPEHIKQLHDIAYMECFNTATLMAPDPRTRTIGIKIPSCIIGQPNASMQDSAITGLNKEAVLTSTVSERYLTGRASTLFAQENAAADVKIEKAESILQVADYMHKGIFGFLALGVLGVAGSVYRQTRDYKQSNPKNDKAFAPV